jgi:hypothetical protein
MPDSGHRLRYSSSTFPADSGDASATKRRAVVRSF